MTIEQANEYFSSLPEGFAPAEELRAALTADVQKVQFVGVAGTAGKTAAAGLLAAIRTAGKLEKETEQQLASAIAETVSAFLAAL